MTIRIVCKNCGSKIDAKDELRGQTRRCPKCHNPILIEEESSAVSPLTPIIHQDPEPEQQEQEEGGLKIRKLRPDNLYVVLGSDREIAYWKNTEGWFVNVGNGYEAVKRAPEKLPDTGVFAFAEGYVAQTDAGRRLKGLRFWKLSNRGVLSVIARGEASDILRKCVEPAILTGAQKRFLLQHIRNHYFFEFTDDAPEIVEFLTGFDSHSSTVGQFVDE